MKAGLLPLIALALLLSLLPARAGTRLAVLAGDGAQPVAELLVARLSEDQELVLVERAELDRVMRESNLSASGATAAALKAAALVHASGVVILESRKFGDKSLISARLVACGPGVIIGAGLFGGEPNASAESIAASFRPLWAKLSVPRESAIPVSLLNLRCATKGSEALEIQLGFLLAHQLTRQPGLFVLERWRMDDLAWEKDRQEPFWDGSHLIDGRIEPGPQGKLKVTVFLRSPGSQPPREITVSGDGTDLPNIATALATRITGLLAGTPTAVEWTGAAENSEYLKEAQWAFDARLYATARSAAEASWALGNRSPELARLRIRVYSALAFPPSPKAHDASPGGYRFDAIDVSQSTAPLSAAFQALGYFHDYHGSRFPKPRNPNDSEENLGSTALLAASRVLRNYYERGLANEASLPDLRQKARETATTLFELTTQANQKPYYYETGGQPGYPKQDNYELEAVYLPYWHDTPAGALEAWKTALHRPEHLNFNRNRLVYRFLKNTGAEDERGAPCLVAWHHESAEELAQLWEAFTQKLAASADPREQLDGALLRVYSATDAPAREAAMICFCQQLWEKREAVLGTPWGREYLTLAERFFPYRWADKQRYRQHWLAFYLENATVWDEVFLRFGFGRKKPQSNELEPVLFEKWRDFKERLTSAGKLTDPLRTRCRNYEAYYFADCLQPDPVDQAIPTVQVTRRWAPQPNEGSVCRTIVWQEDRLWVALRKRNDDLENGKPCYRIRIGAFELPSFNPTQWIETPAELAITEAGSRPVFYLTPTSLFVQDGNRFLRYDRKSATWSVVSLPEYSYGPVLARGNELLAGFSGNESGILKWSAASGKAEVIASNRRRPALTPFDDRPPYAVEGLCGGKNGGFGVLFGLMERGGGFYWCTPGAGASARWEAPLPGKSAVRAALAGSTTLLVSRQCGVAAIDNATGEATQFPGSRFWGSPKTAAPVRLPDAFNNLPYPEQGISIMPALAYEGGRLWTLRIRSDTLGHSVLLHRAERADAPGDTEVRVNLLTPDGRPIAPRAAQMPTEAAYSMAAAPGGIVFWVNGSSGLWFLPIQDFETALAAQRQAPAR